ncbi:MAG: hypothetical protein KF787_11120 [Phycisphaeraceae bacterium]|nr:hypothetical protein [Phycisphaerae bacterium]MBX3393186.1 hypothetical protein [Phycisphaeraceae bacterium]
MDTDRDIIISRVVDGLATSEDWSVLDRLGGADPAVWKEVVVAQRHQALLCDVVEGEVGASERVDAPDTRPAVIRFPGASWKWSGWAAAALVALAWSFGRTGWISSQVHAPAEIVSQAGFGPGSLLPVSSSSADDYLRRYIERGREDGTVVGQMDRRPVIEMRPMAVDGGTAYEVVYARVIFEKATLPDVYRLTTDEAGTLIPVRSRLPSGVVSRSPM